MNSKTNTYKTFHPSIKTIEDGSKYMLKTLKYGNVVVELWNYSEFFVYPFNFAYIPEPNDLIEDEMLFFSINKKLYGTGCEILYKILNFNDKIKLI